VIEGQRSLPVAIYLRVSTDNQTTDNQRIALEAAAAARGWNVVRIYQDHGISGAKGRDKRPGLDALLKDAAKGDFRLVAAWSVDRLGRSLQDLIGFLNELQALGVDLFLHQQGLDTTTPSGRAFYGMLGVFAEFERAMIQQRIRAGLERAKAQGKRLGRKPVPPITLRKIESYLAAGRSIRDAARLTGVSVGVAHRVKQGIAA
jgi:DNA invertase Pin-like site-specific DNA recombinase